MNVINANQFLENLIPWKPDAPLFDNRLDAGIKLGQKIVKHYGKKLNDAIVLGCVRGGLVTALGVVEVMKKHDFSYGLDIVIPRKLSHPSDKEFGIGFLTEDGTAVFLDEIVKENQIDTVSDEMQAHICAQRKELKRRQSTYRKGGSLPDLTDKTVVIVDDGMASGGTMAAAVFTVQKMSKSTAYIFVAVPVASHKSKRILMEKTELPQSNIYIDEYTKCPSTHYWNIDDYYVEFKDVEDETITSIMKDHRKNLNTSEENS